MNYFKYYQIRFSALGRLYPTVRNIRFSALPEKQRIRNVLKDIARRLGEIWQPDEGVSNPSLVGAH